MTPSGSRNTSTCSRLEVVRPRRSRRPRRDLTKNGSNHCRVAPGHCRRDERLFRRACAAAAQEPPPLSDAAGSRAVLLQLVSSRRRPEVLALPRTAGLRTEHQGMGQCQPGIRRILVHGRVLRAHLGVGLARIHCVHPCNDIRRGDRHPDGVAANFLRIDLPDWSCSGQFRFWPGFR
jgi:hypothetical protein